MTIPPYDPKVPLVDDTIADGQPSFLQNFSQLFTAFNLNHVSLTDPTNPGNHNVIQLVEQAQGDSTFSQEISIYSKKVVDQTDQLFMRYPNNGKEIQLTQYQIYPLPENFLGDVLYQIPYFTFLPGGIIVYFGKIIPTATTFYISLSPTICTNIMGINLCPIGTSTLANPLYQSNVALQSNDGKFFNAVQIKNSTTITIPPLPILFSFW